jgi:ferric-dicitrate binding protein FerR (iron transport regulator)
MDQERILELLAKQMSRHASQAEQDELKKLLSSYPQYSYLVEILRSFREEKRHVGPSWAAEELVRENWPALEVQLRQEPENARAKPPALRRRPWAKRAAVWAAVAALGAGLWFFSRGFRHQSRPGHPASYSQVKVPFGAPEKKSLPDGSLVWLNAGSRIRYPDDFGRENREVYLEGEAYFNVSHDRNHPFVVHAGNIVIRVLGTEFNVNAYGDENKVEATLIKGKVEISINGNPEKKIVLTPREKLTVINQEFRLEGKRPDSAAELRKELSFQVKEVVPQKTADPIPEVAWMKDRLVFQNETFSGLARKLERRYDVHIVFGDSTLMRERLSGVFVNENIQKALNLLEMTTPFTYRVQGDSVLLTP